MPEALTNQTDVRTHWGNWVLRRAAAIGFGHPLSLSSAMGCTLPELNHLVQMDSPPPVKQRLVRKLAQTLEIDTSVLLSTWKSQQPESLPMLLSPEMVSLRRIIESCRWLDVPSLQTLADTAEAMLHSCFEP